MIRSRYQVPSVCLPSLICDCCCFVLFFLSQQSVTNFFFFFCTSRGGLSRIRTDTGCTDARTQRAPIVLVPYYMIPVPATIHQLPVIQHAVEFSLMAADAVALHILRSILHSCLYTREHTHDQRHEDSQGIHSLDRLVERCCMQAVGRRLLTCVLRCRSYSSEASF